MALALFGLWLAAAAFGAPSHAQPEDADAQRIDAMLSVHAHARWKQGSFEGYEFVPIDSAVDFLVADRAASAASRRRRAIAKLAAYAPGRFDAQIKRLLGDSPIQVQDLQRIVAKNQFLAQHFLEVLIVNALADLTPSCRWLVPKPYTGGAYVKPPGFGWEFEVMIPRRVDEIARAIDPQSWDYEDCSPFFHTTHLAETSGCCSEGAGTCSYTPDATTGYPPKAPEVPAGKPFDSRPLFEHFCVSPMCGQCEGPQNACDLDIENLLCVQTDYDPDPLLSWCARFSDRYDVNFTQGQSIRVELLGVEGNTIEIDQGNVHARRASDEEKNAVEVAGEPWSVLHVDKYLQLRSSINNGAVGIFLLATTDELAGQIVELGCCNVPGEWWCGL